MIKDIFILTCQNDRSLFFCRRTENKSTSTKEEGKGEVCVTKKQQIYFLLLFCLRLIICTVNIKTYLNVLE